MTIQLTRVKWLNTYSGPDRWIHQNRPEEFGFIAFKPIDNSKEFEVLPSQYDRGCYGHLVYRLNGRLFIIGKSGNTPVQFPLWEITGLVAIRVKGNMSLQIQE